MLEQSTTTYNSQQTTPHKCTTNKNTINDYNFVTAYLDKKKIKSVIKQNYNTHHR